MGSGNDPEQFRILERVESETLPEWASDAEPQDGRNGGGQSAATSGEGADQGASDSTGTGAPGFGVLVAAAALALLAGLARRRR
jgi:PGF-CTERM protein